MNIGSKLPNFFLIIFYKLTDDLNAKKRGHLQV